MPLYTVLAPPASAAEGAPDPMSYVFVKEGFSWPALIIPELWLLFRRMWLVFFIFVAVSLVVLAIDRQAGGPLPGLFLVLAHILFALEGNGLRRWTLIRRGYRIVDVVGGRRVADAEIRFFYEQETPRIDPSQPTPERLRTTLRQRPEQTAQEPSEAAKPDTAKLPEAKPASATPPAPPSAPVTSQPLRDKPEPPLPGEPREVIGLFPQRGGGS